jgi:glycosyltransferase involved in cell wall biosynthesis
MDRKEIVGLFLKNGFQLSRETLPLIEEKPNEYLSFIKKIQPRPFIITKNHLKNFDQEKINENEIKLKKIKKFEFEIKKLEINDYVKHFNQVYDKIKDILLNNTTLEKLVSINKITLRTKEFSLIVSVREKGTKTLLVEDPTGETHVFFDEKIEEKIKTIEAEDILGLVCEREGEKNYIRKIIYPDTPLTREINRTKNEIKIFYLYKPSTLDEERIENLIEILKKTKKSYPVFVYGNWEDKERLKDLKNIFLVLENSIPTLFVLGKINIMTNPFPKYASENILKKRLIKTNNLLNIFVVEQIPDILIASEDETFQKNYKGATILSLKRPDHYFVLNLKTRNVESKEI